MSNTAVQRRVADIKAAGGNPAAAFVTGGEASTPTLAPARVEATRFNNPNFGTAMLMKQQYDVMKSQTVKNTADARATNLDTDIREAGADIEVESKGITRHSSARKAAQDADNLQIQTAKLQEELRGLMSANDIREIQRYIAGKTRDEVIDAIESGAIIRNLQIDTEGIKSDWARIKRAILGIIDTE